MGFNRAVFRADYDARANLGGNASVLANRAFYIYQRFDNRRIGLACCKSLPRRNADVWQARDNSRSVEVDSAKLILMVNAE